MGWLNSEHVQGFLAHFSICATREGRPLGSVALHAWVRQGSKLGRKRFAEAAGVLSDADLLVLNTAAVVEAGRDPNVQLDARSALFELARLGGHIKNNGAPGWRVLRRGWDVLVATRRG